VASAASAATRHRAVFVPLIGGLAAATWLALWAWSASPYARYLQHGGWLDSGPAAVLCRAVPGGDVLVPAALHAAGWVLMIVAMMLPTTLPLLDKFGRMTAARPDGAHLVQVVVAGYLGVWLLFGVAAHALDWLVHEAVARTGWLAANGWVVGAAVIGLAGVFQFTPLKHRCLEQCRTPLSFIMRHWRGDAPRRRAFALGAHHGLFCVGCCWALMLLMFVVGTASVGWMLAIGAVMAVEKNVPWGRRLSAPLGAALVVTALAVAIAEVSGKG